MADPNSIKTRRPDSTSSAVKPQPALSTSIISDKLREATKTALHSNILQHGLGSFSSAMVVVSASYPLDTMRRRIQASTTPLRNKQDYLQIALGPQYKQTDNPWVRNLYSGLPPALIHKGWQLPYRWVVSNTLQEEFFTPYLGPSLENRFGNKLAAPLCSGLAGATTGAMEVALLKWDSEKIAAQTQAQENKTPIRLSLQQAYKAAGVTAARNSLGSFIIFFTDGLIKEFVFNGKKREELGFFQGSVGYLTGGLLSAAVIMPLDTVKVNIQKGLGLRCARTIAKEMYKNHGLGIFYRSLWIAGAFSGLRGGTEFSVAQYFSPFFNRQCKKLCEYLSPTSEAESPKQGTFKPQ